MKTRYRSGRPFVPKEEERRRMLDEGRIQHFRYDLREVLKASDKLDEDRVRAFAQTVETKAARLGIRDAKDYVREKTQEGVVADRDQEAIQRLLDRYSRFR